ncbi:CerR family C-terminal domain-containing protein [Sphingomonas sp. KRR8]|uniref:CerR family C-terminal domain-containing protein n=1 Tax=Sphingomonas sp. KRR8 TaxID=2942996 RepID=UPI00202298EB|nr:CerR family C-terminal domain-containing protein [Sphingomonas sp. KRR8]URD60717.1 CerR family C-terminal domain-containing protein [Sphingomonas sp. KRR8]
MDQPQVDLVSAALPLFGRLGFEGASTRALASAAGRPMSAITYHFGGKHGLYLACADHIRDRIGGFVAATIEQQEQSGPPSPAQARAQLEQLFKVITGAMLQDTEDMARFMMREQQEPTEAFDRIWSGIMGRVLERMTTLVTVVAGDRLAPLAVRVRVMTLMGQMMVFRVAHAAVLRLTGWTHIGPAEVAVVQSAVRDNLAHILDGLSGKGKP